MVDSTKKESEADERQIFVTPVMIKVTQCDEEGVLKFPPSDDPDVKVNHESNVLFINTSSVVMLSGIFAEDGARVATEIWLGDDTVHVLETPYQILGVHGS